MGSTAESDRKRHHLNPMSPTAAATKKHSFLPMSEDKKLDISVLEYQNQKLIQKLEIQKIEHIVLEKKFCQLTEKHRPYGSTLNVVNKSWEELINDVELRSVRTRKWSSGQDVKQSSTKEDGESSTVKDAFLSRLTETGATQSSYTDYSANQMEEDKQTDSANQMEEEKQTDSAYQTEEEKQTDSAYQTEEEKQTDPANQMEEDKQTDPANLMEEDKQTDCEKTKNIVQNITAAIENIWSLKDGLHAAVLKELPEHGLCRQKGSTNLGEEVKKLRLTLKDFLSKHKSLIRELLGHEGKDAKNKANLKCLRGELESVVALLEESNSKVAKLKAESDAAGALLPIVNVSMKHGGGDRLRDKQKDLRDMESTLKELTDEASCQLMELKGLHEERIKVLQQLSDMQNILKNVKSISSSQAYILLKDQIEKSKSEVLEYQALLKNLQVEKDILVWKERELIIKNDVVDVSRRTSAVAGARMNDLDIEIQKQIDGRKLTETKLEEASRDPGRKVIVAEFKSLVSSFPEEMSTMQSQLQKYKDTSSDIHSLRADVQSLSRVLDRKVKEYETLSARSAEQNAEIQRLQAVVQKLKENDRELELILEMYKRESSDSREVKEARDLEYKAWAHVQILKSSLNEHDLELRVKTANEAEAISQQRLAAAEAEIADLRQKLEASKRDISRLSGFLKSKSEENEAYLSEIETIGQAYDDMQTQNQHLLQQITERDDYNVKLVLEGVRARQLQGALHLENLIMEKDIQRANASLNFYDTKGARIGDLLRSSSDHIMKLADDKMQSSTTLESTQKRLLDVRRSTQQVRQSLEESQLKVEKSRVTLAELQIELEKERFKKKRIEEELEVVRKKALHLRAQIEGSSVLKKLQEELREYRDILKCTICLDRSKEVVIKKCFHLFCNHCVQKIMGSRHRKCPECNSSFGPNDVKPIYI